MDIAKEARLPKAPGGKAMRLPLVALATRGLGAPSARVALATRAKLQHS